MPLVAEKKRKYEAERSRRKTSEHAEVGEPPLTDEQRAQGTILREKCWNDLEFFDTQIFPNSSGLKPYGEVQLQSIAHDYSIICDGGRICRAEPRAFAKTTRTCNHALWAVLTDRRRMVPVFSANMDKSKTQIMARWKVELLTNEFLYWMFPELIWPFRALGNKPQGAASQTYRGELTYIHWTADRIVFPDIPGSHGSGSVLVALPLKSCRGATHTMPDGTILRPDLVIFDDVQKDEDADNPNTIRKLEDLIDHTALMLGGHSQTMSAIMNCTVRQPDDLSETYLKKPGWRRVLYKMLAERALREKELWLGKYAEILTAYDPESPEDQRRAQLEALEFYKEHRAEMDEGARVTWEWAYPWRDAEPTEISAIQHAYNILIDNADVFASECQNEPIRDTGGLIRLTPEQIRNKQSGYERNSFPKECSKLTTWVDVHDEILYWQVWAWEPRFTGFCLNYGTYPDQEHKLFTHSDPPIPLSLLFPGLDDDARVTCGLDALLHGSDALGWHGLLRREWKRTDGVPMKIESAGIDANGKRSVAVKKFIRQSPFSALLFPSFGKGVLAATPPMSSWTQYKNNRKIQGPEWVYTKPDPGDPIGVWFDTNWWKTRFHRGFALAQGSQGALYLFKAEPETHRRFAAHAHAENPKEVSCGSRTVFEFKNPLNKENHDFDVAVGNMIAASKAGITSIMRPASKARVSLEELAKRANGRA